ncbi:MAG TPA: PAS domain S-box protein, partial [Planctomycetota bacterium]|nr:PAS domain S-box protein [Planctomycetota bacterium]
MIDRYRQIFLSLSDAVFLESAEGVILEANTAASWLLGIPREQLIGRKMNEFIAQDSLERLIAQRAVLNTVERHQFDTQCRKADGSCINVILDISIVPELSTSGDVYLIAARTASKRDELERELRLQRQCAQGAAHASKRVTLFISSRNEISRYPPAAPSEPPSALDWTVALLHREPLKHELEQAWAGEEKTVGPAWFSPGEALGHDKPGTGALLHQRWLRIHIQPIRLRGAEVTDLCVSIADETELLLRDEAEGFTGRQTCSTLLSSAIFHEFNNYLGVILAQASGLRLTVSEGQLPPPGIGAIIDAAQKAAGLLRRTSDAAIEKSDTWQNLSVNDLLRECAPVLAHVATERISLTLEISPHLPDVSGVARLLKMMLLALGRHAISRLHATGQLALKTFEVPPPLAGLTPSAGISFSVSTGDGGAILALTDEPMEIALCKAILRL